MSVSYRGLKPMLCIQNQELGLFGYIPLLVSLKPSLPHPLCVYVLKYLVFLKKKKKKKPWASTCKLQTL